MEIKMLNIKPSIVIAYALVVLIWSTTPITIKWSSQETDFLFAITMRMVIGTVLAVMLCVWKYKKMPMHKKAVAAYLISAMAVFGAMIIVYWGAQYISSGLVSVLFGLTPMLTAFMAAALLKNERLSMVKVSGSLIGVAGLTIIFVDQMQLGEYAMLGILAVLLSVSIHALSAVLIKRIDHQLPALNIVAGGLLFSLPLFFISYLFFAPPMPEIISNKALVSIIYLGIMGSLVGFVCFYYLLANLSAGSVALITLLTPVLSLWIGYTFNNESIQSIFLWGTALVLLGLIWHQWGEIVIEKV